MFKRIKLMMQFVRIMNDFDWFCLRVIVESFLLRWIVPVVILGLIAGVVFVCMRVF